jgi:hypothetical protein
VRAADLSRDMIAMRRWLDSNRRELTMFDALNMERTSV